MSSLVCVGLSYKTASVELREQAALSIQQQDALLAQAAEAKFPNLEELVIVSTCNRTELYAVGAGNGLPETLLDMLRTHTALTESDLRRVTYCLTDQNCVRHLFRVAASLDSQIIGEPQILGQLTQAYRRASAAGTTLSALMQRAIHTGKRVRHETELGQGALSISAIAASHASRIAGSLGQINALIIGAGEMAHSTAISLSRRGIGKLVIASRTLEHAQTIAAPLGAVAIPYDQVNEALVEADIVITASAAPHTLLYVADIASGLSHRQNRPLLIFDIAMPRNVAPGVGALPGVSLFNLDDLHTEAEMHRVGRENAVPQAEAIVEEELRSFARWQASRQVVPLIRQMRDNAERVRQSELASLARKLPDLSEREQHLLEIFSARLINKLLHDPTVQLKARSADKQGELYANVVNDLFSLTPNPIPLRSEGSRTETEPRPVPPRQLERGPGGEANTPQFVPEPEYDREVWQP